MHLMLLIRITYDCSYHNNQQRSICTQQQSKCDSPDNIRSANADGDKCDVAALGHSTATMRRDKNERGPKRIANIVVSVSFVTVTVRSRLSTTEHVQHIFLGLNNTSIFHSFAVTNATIRTVRLFSRHLTCN